MYNSKLQNVFVQIANYVFMLFPWGFLLFKLKLLFYQMLKNVTRVPCNGKYILWKTRKIQNDDIDTFQTGSQLDILSQAHFWRSDPKIIFLTIITSSPECCGSKKTSWMAEIFHIVCCLCLNSHFSYILIETF